MTPYYSDDLVTIYHGDALDVMRSLPVASADVLLTDPPYSSGGYFRSDRSADPTAKYSRAEVAQYGSFAGDNRDQRSWTAWVAAWSWSALRIVRPGGHAFMFSDWRQLPSVTDAMQMGGWAWRGLIVWHKGAGGGIPQKGKFRQNAEYVVWGTFGTQGDDLTDGAPSSVIEVGPVPTGERVHVTEKPVTLLSHLLRVVPGHPLTVLDPFMGSGSTLMAAKSLGHRAIGVEAEEYNCEIAANRCRQEVLGLTA